ncbi:hypothetical protein, partial [Moorena sp. SIO3H5]|uniref:hypothetical protein n=1 Tax=Moorena sp. SIO3H5 TaxID=2607834 RepID=UPI0025F34D6A
MLNNGMILSGPVGWGSWWNWHLASFMLIFVRGAGCSLYNGMIFSAPVGWESWWNWHLASFMLIFLRAGCPLYSYSLQDRRNGLYIIIDNNLCRSFNNFS